MATKTETKPELLSTCFFKYRNETTGAHRYEQITADGRPFTIAMGALVGTLYLRKSALDKVILSVPRHLKVEITTQSEG